MAVISLLDLLIALPAVAQQQPTTRVLDCTTSGCHAKQLDHKVLHGPTAVTMRWLTPDHAIRAVQVTTRYPFNHGAPIHIGDPAAIGADLSNPLVGPPVDKIRDGVVPVFWACGVTPQEAALAAGIDIMVTHAPAHGFVTDWEARRLATP
jgi:uncharacterized protein YcsI (UPF0317 family)